MKTISSANQVTAYGDLMRELTRKASEERIPINGVFELTARCNLHCQMCYIPKSKSKCSSVQVLELKPVEWIEIAKEAIDHGMLSLLLSGGEVFIRKDFFDIYYPLTRLGILLTLFTNATMVDPSTAARLAEAPPHRTEITLYGATSSTYEKVTGVSGSYLKCCTGIESLLENGIQIALKTTLTQENYHELEEMQQMASSWGVPFSASWLLFGRRDGSYSSINNYRLHPEECAKLELKNQAFSGDWYEMALQGFKPDTSKAFYCQAGKSSFVVNSFGEMSPCVELVEPASKPLQSGFKAAWEKVQQFVNEAPVLSASCVGCEFSEYCRRCPASALTETGSLVEPVPYLCEVAKSRRDLTQNSY